MNWLKKLIRALFLVKEIISQEGVLHFQRFRFLQTPWFAIYLHHLLQSDQDKHPHDHPRHFCSLILRGSYLEQSSHYPNFSTIHSNTFSPGNINWHDARDVHHIILNSSEVWTLFFVWGRRRTWGYRINKEWVDFQTYRKMKREGAFNK